MKTLVIILIILAVLLVAGLVWSAMKRKRDTVARERASELRSHAAETAAATPVEEARARETEAEAEQAKARADRLEAEAQEQRTSFEMTRAQHEDHLREADRVDPDVDHTADDYQAGAGTSAGTGTGEGYDSAATDGELPRQHGGGSV